MAPSFLFYFLWIPIDDFDTHTFQFPSFSLFNQLSDIANLFQVLAVLVVLLVHHILVPFPMSLALHLDKHLFHHSTELVALHLVHAFLLVPLALVRFLLPTCLLRFQFSDDCPFRWLFHSKKFLVHLLQISPFFTLMSYVGPESIKLHTTQLFRVF